VTFHLSKIQQKMRSEEKSSVLGNADLLVTLEVTRVAGSIIASNLVGRIYGTCLLVTMYYNTKLALPQRMPWQYKVRFTFSLALCGPNLRKK
jgi:hypothetical protein